jgi:hypothetical protein
VSYKPTLPVGEAEVEVAFPSAAAADASAAATAHTAAEPATVQPRMTPKWSLEVYRMVVNNE